MSYVLALAFHDFVLFCGDTRASNGNVSVTENYKKIFKVNSNIIVGCGGNINSNRKLFSSIFCEQDHSDFLNPLVTKNINFSQLTYNELKTWVDEQYYSLIDRNKKEEVDYSFHSCIGGWDGNNMCLDAFFSSGIRQSIKITNLDDCKYVSMENNEIHINNFLNFMNLSPLPHGEQKYKTAFQQTLDIGVRFDNTINNVGTFETIRRNDVLL